jgi:hypothetical protein
MKYRHSILSDNSHHSSLRQFRLTAGEAAFAAITFCQEMESTHFSSIYGGYYYFFYAPILKKIPEIPSARWQGSH